MNDDEMPTLADRFLLDTHALIWMFIEPRRIAATVQFSLQQEKSKTYFSAASLMEMETKHRLGKLALVSPLLENFERNVSQAGLEPLPITVRHARLAGSMNIAHKDPFDRLLIAQAIADNLTLVSNEVIFDSFGVRRLW